MSSYYKRINGVNYDRAMLDTADKSVKGKGDGRISLEDAKALVKNMKDGGRITEIELRTFNYIRGKYKFTEPALKYVEESLSDDSNSKSKVSSVHDKPKLSQKEKQENKPSKSPKKSNKKYLLIILIILILLLIIFLLSRISCEKGAGNDKLVPVQKTEEKAATENKADTADKTAADKVATEKAAAADNKDLKNNIASGENSKGQYVIKKNDTLTRISKTVYGDHKFWKSIYNANEDKIKNPNLIYYGQVLTIPEKKDETSGDAAK